MKNVSNSIESFVKINKDINTISQSMMSIEEITSTQSNDVSDIMTNVSVLAEKINKATENNSGKSEETLIIVKKILSELTQLNNATNALKYSSDNMDEIVSSFKLS